ncbi:YcaO-like family protein [Ornithinimicrobium sp. F0845]|uniref:YcaO-like family protein n=1 Tax=Ornithinimicrobium sp. F0845 TaxID=2926412 RepID=UPI001FF368F4|nr:YcaO-like family protein [Ornithinimicrobium sp. F0845]MCK0112070.1 YcaO-like family protein [Ornithinimicrobium sp. F0845]
MSTHTSQTIQDEDTTGVLDDVRPLLRRDVLYADTGQGVFIRHADDAFVMRGSSIYRWLSVLAPHLDGSLTVGDLRSSLPEAQQQMLTSLVKVLLERDFARDSVPEELGEAVLEHPFAHQIEFIRHYVDAPVRRFEQFRAATVLILGSGPLAESTARILADNGLESATLTDHLPTQAGDLSADVVVALGDAIGLDGVRSLARVAAEAGVPVIPAVTVGGRVFVGPLLDTGGAAGVDSLIARLAAGLDADESADFWRRLAGAPSAARPVPVAQHASMLGTLIGFEVFRLLTGCLDPETRDAVVVQNVETLDIVKEPLLGHPSDPRAAGRVESAPGEELRAELDVFLDPEAEVESQALHEQADGYLDLVRHHTGVFRQFTDLEIDQSPLKVGRVEVGGLAGRDGSAPARRTITGYHTRTPLQARFRALCEAALQYVDTWGPETARDLLEQVDVPASALDVWSGVVPGRGKDAAGTGAANDAGGGKDAGGAGVWATSLVSGDRRRIPVAAAYPFSAANDDQWVLRSTVGAGAGASPADAAIAGLFSAITFRAVLTALRDGSPLDTLEVQEAEPGTVLRFLVDTCGTLGLEPVLVDVSLPGCGGTVIAFAERDGEPVVALATGASLELAVIDALVSLVGRVQTDGPATTEVGPLADLDPRGLPLSGRSRPATADRQPVTSMMAALGAGTDVLVVDTGLPDLAQGGIRTARVLLTTASGPSGEDAPLASDDGPTHPGRR